MFKNEITIKKEPKLKTPAGVKAYEPNTVTYAAMESAKNGQDMYGPFDSVADLMESLDA